MVQWRSLQTTRSEQNGGGVGVGAPSAAQHAALTSREHPAGPSPPTPPPRATRSDARQRIYGAPLVTKIITSGGGRLHPCGTCAGKGSTSNTITVSYTAFIKNG
ncbi:hypothetical protein Y1Q_0007969 [Alligator mississippiensis]|uniref:Uncharacterized protein n=1 Tax=Alligator mississippiensis TaxID=8496 RepID=A0A151NEZ8_ALLMI|nr:hypothetical protein Y1Q_0007969 [Alligator mississippiensis]